jgi:hypothetical protein
LRDKAIKSEQRRNSKKEGKRKTIPEQKGKAELSATRQEEEPPIPYPRF